MNVSKNDPVLYTSPEGVKLYGVAPGKEGDDFIREVMTKRTNPEKLRFNGSTERAVLTDEQVTELAEKYDPTDMTQEQYQKFLDDLQSYGVISQMEKELMGYAPGATLLGYVDEDGDWIQPPHNACPGPRPLSETARNMSVYERTRVHLGADGNLKKTLSALGEFELSAGEAPGDPDGTRRLAKAAEQERKRLNVMTGTVNRILERRKQLGLKNGGDAKTAKTEETTQNRKLKEQETAAGGDFWIDLHNLILESMRKKQKDEQDKTVEMLFSILEGRR